MYILQHFDILESMKSKLKCKLCSYVGCLGSVRRRLEHLLEEGASVKACTANKSKLSAVMQAKLQEELLTLNAAAARRKTQKATKQKAVKEMELSARPRKQQKLPKYTKNKDIIDMDYCRLVVTTACKTGLLPPSLSPISTITHFNYSPILFKDVHPFRCLLQPPQASWNSNLLPPSLPPSTTTSLRARLSWGLYLKPCTTTLRKRCWRRASGRMQIHCAPSPWMHG